MPLSAVCLDRKVPTLRLCFRHREDVLWACDMNREQIDFKVRLLTQMRKNGSRGVVVSR